MPAISVFYGIIIRMFFDEHAPPHFLAEYGEFKASVGIRELSILDGSLPRRAQQLVQDWAELHQAELLTNWDLCRQYKQPRPIAPLN